MSFKTNTSDFIAKIDFLPTSKGGRKTFANSGYRPQIKFAFSKMMTTGEQIFIEQDFVEPGQSVTAKVKILSPDFYKNKLETGMSFQIMEGKQIIAKGELLKILNKDLIKTI